MVAARDTSTGRFSVDIDLSNHEDVVLARAGKISPDDVRRVRIRGVVDSGAARLVVPEDVIRRLGVPRMGNTGVRNADGRVAERKMVSDIELSYAGRSGTFSAIVEPSRDSALVGAIVLEDLDLIVDCTKQRLEPRDPKRIISEIE